MSRSAKPQVQVRRIYDPREPSDGHRVLVDRLWPRGVSKADAHIDDWLKDVTPSSELRRWFHGPEGTYDEFCRRYEAELTEPDAAQALHRLQDLAKQGPLTLLTAAKHPDRSHTSVLLRHL